MPDTEQQDETLSTLLVKEAVSKGMDSPMRDPILEAVEESEGSGSMPGRALPLAGGLVGLGVAIGYLIGSGELDTDEMPLEDVEKPDVLDDAADEVSETIGEVETKAESESEADMDEDGGSSRLPRLFLLIAAVVGLEFLRRRRGSGEEEDWEPIEEFEPATSASFDEEDEGGDEDETEMTDSEEDEAVEE